MLFSFAHVSISSSLSLSASLVLYIVQSRATVRPPIVLEFSLVLKLLTARPEFTDTLAIKAGRHPILEKVQGAGSVVPNDVFCCEQSSFQLVQGPKYAPRSNLNFSSLMRNSLQHVRFGVVQMSARKCS